MESLSKNKAKHIKSLHKKKFRDEFNSFIVEGEKMVKEAILNFSNQIETILYTKESFLAFENFFRSNAIEVSENELKSVSTMQTPNKSLVVMKKMNFDEKNEDFTLVLDTVQDPGNFGTILRLADWFDIKKIICSKETVDIYNPKVVQASMGAVFRIPVFYHDLNTFLTKNKQQKIFGALLEGKNIYQESITPNGILILGNEGKGISPEIQKHINEPITIPRFGKAESLNVSVATGIILSEFFRNR